MDPTIQNEEQKKSKLHARDGEDDTSYPSDKCGKHMLDLPDEKPAIEAHQWVDMLDFRCCTSKTTQVDKNLIVVCAKEIKDCEKAYDEASNFFETEFGKLEEKQPCPQSSSVITAFRYMQKAVKKSIDIANESFPYFEKDVENYMNYRNGPLPELKFAKDRYLKKLEQLAETPNIEKIIKWLLYEFKDYKEIENRSGLTPRVLSGITFLLRRDKDIFIPLIEEITMEEELTVEKEEFSESEMVDLLIQHKDAMKEVSSLRIAYDTARAIVNEFTQEHAWAKFYHVLPLEGALGSADYRLRIMRQQLELLRQKDVINSGYDKFDAADWKLVWHIGFN